MKLLQLHKTQFFKKNQRVLIFLSLSFIVLLGLIIRLLLTPHPGYEFDVGVNQGWGRSAVELGLAHSYTEQVNGNMLPNYAPFSIMLFTSMAYIQDWFFGGFEGNPLSYRVLIKLPAIFADILTALSLFFFVGKWRNRRQGLLAALIFCLHPAVFHESAIWGQTDSIFTMFMTVALGLFLMKRSFWAGLFFAFALLTKAQAVMLLPLFFILYVRGGWRTFIDGLIGGLLATIIVMLPFALGGTLKDVIDAYTNSVGFYPIVSSAAYNFWWSLHGDAAGSLQDSTVLFSLLTYKQFGLFFFGLSYLYALWLSWRYQKVTTKNMESFPIVFASASFIALSFFLWNTQMHERYLFPFVALGLPLVFTSVRGAVLYGLVSLMFYVNLLGWLPAGGIDKALFATFPALDIFIASVQVITFFELAVYLWKLKKTVPVPPTKKHGRIFSFARHTLMRFAPKRKKLHLSAR